MKDLNGDVSGSGRYGTFAEGGFAEFYAGGGMREHHVAQFARAGAYWVWAEPETGGEAAIPLSPTKRATSVPVLAETASRLGFDLVPTGARQFADGGSDRPLVMQRGHDNLARMQITGRLEIGGDGLARIIDGRIARAAPFAGSVTSRFGNK